MGNSKRVTWIDCEKAVAILMVVMVHLLPAGLFEKYLHLIVIEPFLIVYGLCSTRKDSLNKLKDTVIRRFYSIMVPYFLWAMIFDTHSIKNLIYLLWGTHSSLVKAHSSGVLWFLPPFFVAVIIFEFVLYVSKDDMKKFLFLNVIFFFIAFLLFEFNIRNLPWGLNVAVIKVPFMGVGYLIKKYINKEKSRNTKNEIVKVFLCCVGILSGFSVLILNPDKGYVQMANADYGNIFIYFIASSGAVISIMFIVKRLNEISKLRSINNYISDIGKKSLLIMILHRDFAVYYEKILSIVGIRNCNLVAIICAIVVLIITYYMSIIVLKIAPILAGKR